MRPLCLIGILLLFFCRYRHWKDGQNRVAEFCAEFSHKTQVVTLEGELRFQREGEWLMEAPAVGEGPNGQDLPTRARLKGVSGRPLSGHRYRVVGTVRCMRLLQNPSVRGDGFFAFHRPEVVVSSGAALTDQNLGEKASFATADFLKRQFEAFPSLTGLVLAVWCGELTGFPPRLYELYRAVGLLPILALSGQHVLILSRLLLLLSIPLGWAIFRWSIVGRCRCPISPPWVALLAGGVLYWSAPGVDSVYRTMAMLLAAAFLRARQVHASSLQIALTAFALILLWTPHQLLSVGFMLSAIFTSITLRLFVTDSGPNLGKNMAGDLIFLCLTSIPVTMFFFAKISLLAPLAQLTLGLVWEFFWIPTGFFLPLLKALLPIPTDSLMGIIEVLWERFLEFQLRYLEGATTTYLTTPRLTWLELALTEWLALRAALVLRRGE